MSGPVSSDEGSNCESEKADFEFLKPIGIPVKRKRSLHSAQTENQPPALSRKDAKDSLDVFNCVGMLYYSREFRGQLERVSIEINSVIENCKYADFTVNVAKTISAKVENPALTDLIDTWEQIENIWQILIDRYISCFLEFKVIFDRYMAAAKCFLSIWEAKNIVLEHMACRLQGLLDAVAKSDNDNYLDPFEKKTIHSFSLDDDISTQLVSMQKPLIRMTLELFCATRQLDPHGDLQKEWLVLREVRSQVKSFLVKLGVDFEHEFELAREKCGGDVSFNNTLKELCMSLRKCKQEVDIVVQKQVDFFVISANSETKLDNFLTSYLVHRITKRGETCRAVFLILRLLCQRGTGSVFPDDMRKQYKHKEPPAVTKAIGNFQAQVNAWNRMDFVKSTTQGKDLEFWGDLAKKIEEEKVMDKRKRCR